MRNTPRRSFLKHAGHATAAGWLAGGLAAAATRIAIIRDDSDKLSSAIPVGWAIGQLRHALEGKGATCAVLASSAQAGEFQAAVIIGREETDLPKEAFRLAPGKQNGKPFVRPLPKPAVSSMPLRNWPTGWNIVPIRWRR